MRRALRRPVVAALVAFAVTLPALELMKARSAAHYAVSRNEAVQVARTDPQVAKALSQYGYSRTMVTPLDENDQRVSFLAGQRLVVHALVNEQHQVTRVAVDAGAGPATGSTIVNQLPILICCLLLFILMTASVPLISLRNLDVIAFATFTGSIWLFDYQLVEPSIRLAYMPLVYLAARFSWIGLRGGGAAPRSSLYWRLTASWSASERQRVLRFTAIGVAVGAAALAATSTGPSDVAYASLTGATDLLHGISPYGHIGNFIVHGDTYPPLNYVLYMPAAAVMPVTNFFDDPEAALVLAAIALLIVAAGLYRVISREAGRADARPAEAEPPSVTGMRAAIAWLIFPPVLLAASEGNNDLVLGIFLIGALSCLARRRTSAVILGAAAWMKLVPVLVLPIWLARLRKREALEVVGILAAISAGLLGWLVILGGPGAIPEMLRAVAFQFQRGSLSSFWNGIGWLQPVAQAALVAVVVAGTVAVIRDVRLRDDLPRLAALLAGIFLLSQLGANYWTWAYLPWAIVPALLVIAPVQALREPAVATKAKSASVDGRRPAPAVS